MFSEIGLNPNLLDYVHELSISELETLSDYALYLIEMKERIYGADTSDYEYLDELDEQGEKTVWNESF